MSISPATRWSLPLALAVLAGPVVLAAPAVAATLPADDEMFSVEYLEEGSTGSIWQVSPDSPTPITEVAGSPVAMPAEIVDSAYDPTTGAAYVIGNGYSTPCTLWSVTVDPPALTFIANITDGTDPVVPDCNAFDILPNGTAYVTHGATTLATINLATGIVTDVAELTNEEQSASVSWIKYDPATDTTFAMGNGGEFYELDLATGILTFLTDLELDEAATYDADIDSAGTIWFQAWGFWVSTWSFDPADPVATVTQESEEFEGWGSDTLWIMPAEAEEESVVTDPELADTGATDGAVLLFGSLALMTLGAALVLRRRAAA